MTVAELGITGARDPLEVARKWLDEHSEVALATVASTWGSAPVPVGGQLVMGPGDRFQGSVSGGCVEADVIAASAGVVASGRPRLIEFGVAEETAWRVGLPCGGQIKVLIEPLTRPHDREYLDRVLAARQARSPLAVVTNVVTGTRVLYEPGTALPPEIGAAFAASESRLLDTPEGSVFLQALVPPVRVVIVGATSIGQVLADIARHVAYDVVVVDPRPAFLSEERFTNIARLGDWPETSLKSVGLDARTAVVALTHAAHLDDEAIIAALRGPCLYIGALGSKRTHENRVTRLKAVGFGDQDLSRIHAPIGLKIGAKGPAEIAVAILAEIIKAARGT